MCLQSCSDHPKHIFIEINADLPVPEYIYVHTFEIWKCIVLLEETTGGTLDEWGESLFYAKNAFKV